MDFGGHHTNGWRYHPGRVMPTELWALWLVKGGNRRTFADRRNAISSCGSPTNEAGSPIEGDDVLAKKIDTTTESTKCSLG